MYPPTPETYAARHSPLRELGGTPPAGPYRPFRKAIASAAPAEPTAEAHERYAEQFDALEREWEPRWPEAAKRAREFARRARADGERLGKLSPSERARLQAAYEKRRGRLDARMAELAATVIVPEAEAVRAVKQLHDPEALERTAAAARDEAAQDPPPSDMAAAFERALAVPGADFWDMRAVDDLQRRLAGMAEGMAAPSEEDAPGADCRRERSAGRFALERYQVLPALLMAPRMRFHGLLCHYSTGAGKTCVVYQVLREHLRAGGERPVFYITPEESIKEEVYKNLEGCGPPPEEWYVRAGDPDRREKQRAMAKLVRQRLAPGLVERYPGCVFRRDDLPTWALGAFFVMTYFEFVQYCMGFFAGSRSAEAQAGARGRFRNAVLIVDEGHNILSPHLSSLNEFPTEEYAQRVGKVKAMWQPGGDPWKDPEMRLRLRKPEDAAALGLCEPAEAPAKWAELMRRWGGAHNERFTNSKNPEVRLYCLHQLMNLLFDPRVCGPQSVTDAERAAGDLPPKIVLLTATPDKTPSLRYRLCQLCHGDVPAVPADLGGDVAMFLASPASDRAFEAEFFDDRGEWRDLDRFARANQCVLHIGASEIQAKFPQPVWHSYGGRWTRAEQVPVPMAPLAYAEQMVRALANLYGVDPEGAARAAAQLDGAFERAYGYSLFWGIDQRPGPEGVPPRPALDMRHEAPRRLAELADRVRGDGKRRPKGRRKEVTTAAERLENRRQFGGGGGEWWWFDPRDNVAHYGRAATVPLEAWLSMRSGGDNPYRGPRVSGYAATERLADLGATGFAATPPEWARGEAAQALVALNRHVAQKHNNLVTEGLLPLLRRHRKTLIYVRNQDREAVGAPLAAAVPTLSHEACLAEIEGRGDLFASRPDVPYLIDAVQDAKPPPMLDQHPERAGQRHYFTRAQLHRLAQVFSDPRNAQGEYVGAMAIGPWSKEGVDYKEVDHVVFADGCETQAEEDQVAGRAMRFCSFRQEPPERYRVHFTHLVSVPPPEMDGWGPDAAVMHRRTGGLIDKVVREGKRAALNCVLDQAYNDYRHPDSHTPKAGCRPDTGSWYAAGSDGQVRKVPAGTRGAVEVDASKLREYALAWARRTANDPMPLSPVRDREIYVRARAGAPPAAAHQALSQLLAEVADAAEAAAARLRRAMLDQAVRREPGPVEDAEVPRELTLAVQYLRDAFSGA